MHLQPPQCVEFSFNDPIVVVVPGSVPKDKKRKTANNISTEVLKLVSYHQKQEREHEIIMQGRSNKGKEPVSNVPASDQAFVIVDEQAIEDFAHENNVSVDKLRALIYGELRAEYFDDSERAEAPVQPDSQSKPEEQTKTESAAPPQSRRAVDPAVLQFLTRIDNTRMEARKNRKELEKYLPDTATRGSLPPSENPAIARLREIQSQYESEQQCQNHLARQVPQEAVKKTNAESAKRLERKGLKKERILQWLSEANVPTNASVPSLAPIPGPPSPRLRTPTPPSHVGSDDSIYTVNVGDDWPGRQHGARKPLVRRIGKASDLRKAFQNNHNEK